MEQAGSTGAGSDGAKAESAEFGGKQGADSGKHAARNEAAKEELTPEERLYALGFSTGLSIRYHGKRRAFFERLHHTCMAVSAIFASATFSNMLSQPSVSAYAQGLAAVFAVASALDVVLDFTGKSKLHNDLKRRFSDLAIRANEANAIHDIKSLENERLRIEQDEPSELGALCIICRNEEALARGHKDIVTFLTPWQRFAAHFWPFSGVDFTAKTA